MISPPSPPRLKPAVPCPGLPLDRVGWGHRQLFAEILTDLSSRGLIGPSRAQVTDTLIGMLRQADQGPFDHVLHRFLSALNPRTGWLLDIPDLFAEVVNFGRDLAVRQPQRGLLFFETLAAGGLGDSAEQVTQALAVARRLRGTDEDLALAFLRGYHRLAGRLESVDTERFVEEGLAAFARDPRCGLAFMEGTLASAEALVRGLAQECCLHDIQDSLGAFVAALVGHSVALAKLNCQPATGLAAGHPSCLCFRDCLFLPERVRRSNCRERNRSWYTLAAAMAAGSLRFDGFSRLHGLPQYPTLLALTRGGAPLAVNAMLLAEWRRLLGGCLRAWPGLRRLQRFWLEEDLAAAAFAGVPGSVRRFLLGGDLPPALARLAESAEHASSVRQTAAAVDAKLLVEVSIACPELAQNLLPPISFLPDAMIPAYTPGPSGSRGLTGLHPATDGDRPPRDTPLVVPATETTASPEDGAEPAVFVYDEWSRDEHDYRRGYCHVHEVFRAGDGCGDLPPDVVAEGQRSRRAFERLKPDAVRRERYLRDGDEINAERLVHYLLQRGADPAPRIDFYERPRISRRDLALLALLDVSGSTAEFTAGGERILDMGRRAMYVLGEGLAAVGDQFALCGFHSAGPKQCSFMVFKDFADPWGRAAVARLAAAAPARNTRIGPALRHAGRRLASMPNRQRLILLVTDGRPLDSDYDPASHYGHCDVRKACEENARLGVRTFGVCTEPRSRADMELMFPGRRFVILPDVRQLPRLLPQLYARLTR